MNRPPLDIDTRIALALCIGILVVAYVVMLTYRRRAFR